MPIEIINQRRFRGSRERVFAAFAQPEKLAQWWGPTGFSNAITQFEFRAGGWWRVIMRGPDGTEFDNLSRFVAVDPPQRVVYEHVEAAHSFTMTTVWADVAPDQTELTWRMELADTPEHAAARDFIQRANEQNFDRLSAFLEPDATHA